MRAGEHVTPTVRLVRPLGFGAMGTVWTAEHLTLGTHVAVKLMMPSHTEDPEFVARFEQEAQAAARIKSPHVVQVLDQGVAPNGVQFIVMELLEGETLGRRLLRLGTLPLEDVVRIVVHTANALSEAHRIHIVHRDIKPDNLFLIDVGGDLFVKVLDFGIAKLPRSGQPGMTATGRLMGTPLYMSPEQLVSAKHVDHRTDLWALAAVAYQALTGKVPFQGESIGAQTLAVHARGFQLPSALRPGLPAAVDAWAARALQPDPAARFGSARELADTLAEAARGMAPAKVSAVAVDTPSVMTAPGDATAPGETTLPEPLRPETEKPVIRTAPIRDPRDPTLVSASRPWVGPVPEIQIGVGRIRLVLTDIVKAGTEAIVNATDRSLPGSLGVDLAIHQAAGPELKKELRRLGAVRVGSAVITGAGWIPPPTRFIIHAVGPDYSPERDEKCAALLRRTYVQSLLLAEENNIRSVAFPAISTGMKRYPMDKAAPIAVNAAADHLAGPARSVQIIVFALLDREGMMPFAAALEATFGVKLKARP